MRVERSLAWRLGNVHLREHLDLVLEWERREETGKLYTAEEEGKKEKMGERKKKLFYKQPVKGEEK